MEIKKSYWHSDGDRISLSVPFFKVDKERRIVSGFATLDNVDRHNDIVDAEASIKAFEAFRGNLREMHQPIAVGKVTNFREEQFFDQSTGQTYRGVFVDTYVSKGAQDTWEKVLDGTLSGFSIGGNITKVDTVQKNGDSIRVIKEYELVELSLVDSPANQLANIFAVQKSDSGNSITGMAVDLKMDTIFWCENDQIAVAKESDSSTCLVCETEMTNIGWVESNDIAKNEEIGKAVDRHISKAGPSSSTLLPLAPRDLPWDGTAAEMRVREWASSDNSGNKETINWRRYSNAFAWHDAQMPDNFTSYKLGFADVIDGRLVAVPRGVFAAAAALEGARGGVMIPESDKATARSLLSRYYNKMRSEFNDESIQDPFSKSLDDETNIEGGAANMEIEKNDEVEAVEEITKANGCDGNCDCNCNKSVEEPELEKADTIEDSVSEEVEEAEEIEKAAVSDVEVEEPDFVKMLDDLKTFFGDNITKSAEETKSTVDELSKTIDARITELADKHDSLSKAVENIKSAIDTIEKRVDLVENETAVKKSRDLEGSKEEKTIRKGIWSGSFLGVRDL